jgi:FkbM family methyltransferase
MHPPIFHEYQRQEIVSDGRSVYDFLGGAIDADYKRDWGKNTLPLGARLRPGYPPPSEWIIDWIACLLAARLAGKKFNVIELGAGYGQWMVTSIMAFKLLHPDSPAHGMALEAEGTHYEWLLSHTNKNLGRYSDVQTDLLHAAAGYDGTAQFPVVQDPDRNYGAGYSSLANETATQDVECLSMQAIYSRFGEPVIDLLHVDIQGAEADLISNPGFVETLCETRFVLFGTHRSDCLHSKVKCAVEKAGLEVFIEWPRNSLVETIFGPIKTNDGAILALRPEIKSLATDLTFPQKIQK